MRENKLRTAWAAGRGVINGWLAIPSSFSAEIMAQLDWDSLCIDIQHGLIGYSEAVPMLQAISTTAVTPLVRVPWNDPAIIMKCLDAGAYGVICPMINNRAEAERFIGACRYPPLGYRSVGPARASLYGGADYLAHANEVIVTLAMIETVEAVRHIEEIVTTPHLDGIYIGPADLGLSMGKAPILDPTDSEVLAAIDHVAKCAKSAGIRVGIHTGSTASAHRWLDKGFDLISLSTEARILANAAAQMVGELRTRQPKA